MEITKHYEVKPLQEFLPEKLEEFSSKYSFGVEKKEIDEKRYRHLARRFSRTLFPALLFSKERDRFEFVVNLYGTAAVFLFPAELVDEENDKLIKMKVQDDVVFEVPIDLRKEVLDEVLESLRVVTIDKTEREPAKDYNKVTLEELNGREVTPVSFVGMKEYPEEKAKLEMILEMNEIAMIVEGKEEDSPINLLYQDAITKQIIEIPLVQLEDKVIATLGNGFNLNIFLMVGNPATGYAEGFLDKLKYTLYMMEQLIKDKEQGTNNK